MLLKPVSATIQNEVKNKKRGFLSIFLGTLGTHLIGNMLAGKGAIATSQGRGTNSAS